MDPWNLSNVDPCVVSYRGSRDEVDLLYFMMIYLTLEVPVFLCYDCYDGALVCLVAAMLPVIDNCS